MSAGAIALCFVLGVAVAIAVPAVIAFGLMAIRRSDARRGDAIETSKVVAERDDLAERVAELEEGIEDARALAQANQVSAAKEAQKGIDRVIRQASEGPASAAVDAARARRAARRAARGLPPLPAGGVPDLPGARPAPDDPAAAPAGVPPGP